MPRRNLLLIFGVALVSLVCYLTADRNPLGRYFSEVVDHIERRYVADVDRRRLWNAAVQGMIGELHDPYSAYINPENAARLDEELEQQFGGIGIRVAPDPETERLTVISPIVGSPAYRAGILAGDVIAKIDGASTRGMTFEEASRRMRGRPGEPVQLTVERPGRREPIDLPIIQREIIQIESVLGDTRRADDRWNFMLDADRKIGYVRIVNFGKGTVEELKGALEALRAQGMKGLILDVRNNPGGLLESAIGVCQLFIPEGKQIVTLRGRDKRIDREFVAGGGEKFLGFPMAVLVNGGSASASEIVAACLQDHQRAVVIGERSFGKGTVQDVISLHGDRGKLALTTADYWRPSGHNIHRRADAKDGDEWGVTPDDGFKVKMSNDQRQAWTQWRRQRDVVRPRNGNASDLTATQGSDETGDDEQTSAGDARWTEDPVLRRAVEYLESQLEKNR